MANNVPQELIKYHYDYVDIEKRNAYKGSLEEELKTIDTSSGDENGYDEYYDSKDGKTHKVVEADLILELNQKVQQEIKEEHCLREMLNVIFWDILVVGKALNDERFEEIHKMYRVKINRLKHGIKFKSLLKV